MPRDENGSLIIDEEAQLTEDIFAESDAMYGMSGADRLRLQDQQATQQDIDTFDQRAEEAIGRDDRPDWVSGPGQAISEIGKIAANNGVALLTDTFDAVAAVGDLFVEGGQELYQRTTGKGEGGTWDDVFNDRDNPWTQWRRETFRPETKSGQAINDVARGVIGTLFLVKAGPKALLKVPTKGAAALWQTPGKAVKGGSALLRLGGLLPKLKGAAGSTKAGQQIGKVTQAVTSKIEPIAEGFAGLKSGLKKLETGDKAADLAKVFQKGTAAQKAAQIGSRTPELTLPLIEASKLLNNAEDIKGLSGMFQTARASAKALTTGLNAPRIRTVGEALVWDTFAAMNMAGEGDDEFDQTFGDMLVGFGMDPGFFQTTNFADSSLDRKLKQALETAPFTFAFEGLTDLITLFRYSKQFKSASKVDKNKIIAALNEQSQELAEGLSKVGPRNAQSDIDNGITAGRINPFANPKQLDSLYDSLQGTKQSQSYLNDLNAEQLLDLQRRQQQGQPKLPGGPDFSGEAVARDPLEAQVSVVDDPMAPGQAAQLPPGKAPAGVLSPAIEPVQVRDVTGQKGLPPARSPIQDLAQGMEVASQRPFMTPQTISAAFRDDMNATFKTLYQGGNVSDSLAEGMRRVQQLVPNTRVDAIDLLGQNPLRFNDAGGTQVPESIWYNAVINRGLKEGWATIDPLTMDVVYVRGRALSLDRGDRSINLAKSIDQIVDTDKYEEWLESVEPMNPGSMDPKVQDDLARREAVDAYDKYEDGEYQRSKVDAERQSAKAAVEANELEITEAQRLDAAGAAAAKVGPTDDEVITENLGRLIVEMNGGQAIKPPSIEKAATGRGWTLTDENGEAIQSFTTKRAATKAADKAKREQAEALLAKAKQMELDESPQQSFLLHG